jgi:hypothetical protein
MMGGDLRVLAEKYVALSGEIEDVRRAMLGCLTNGAGDAAVTPRPIQTARASGGKQHPNAIAAQQAEAKIVELLRETPGLKSAQIAKETRAKVNTTIERLKRLKARGQVQGGGDDGWQAVA